MRKQTKIAAIASAAALLAIGASMTSFAAVGWVPLGYGDWEYHDRYGDPVYDEWKTYGDKWFYLGDDGVMVRNQVFRDSADHIFYVNDAGERQYGWQSFSNDEDLDLNNDGIEDSVLWMYFDTKSGKAAKAGDNSEAAVVSLEWSGGKNNFLFNSDGYMLSGWQIINDETDMYYLGTENDGYARTFWQWLDETPIDHVCPDPEDDSHWFYFGNDGKAYRAAVDGDSKEYKIDGKYYSFDYAGHLNTSWVVYDDYAAATPPNATTLIFNDENGSQGYDWVYTQEHADCDGNGGKDSHWYYLVTYRGTTTNSKGETVPYVTRSIAFNAGTGKYAAKSIKGKTYLFDGDEGRMMVGVVDLRKEDIIQDNSEYSTLADGIFENQQVVKDFSKGIYYFNDPDEPKSSVAGQMMTGKISTMDDDYNEVNYYFAKKALAAGNHKFTYDGQEEEKSWGAVRVGQAYTNAIVDGVLYDEDGHRVEAKDGNTYMYYITKADIIVIKGNAVVDVIREGTPIAVSNTGRVKTSNDVKIDDTYYEVGDHYEIEYSVKKNK